MPLRKNYRIKRNFLNWGLVISYNCCNFAAHFKIRDVAQSGSAPALGAGSPRFESWYPDKHSTQLLDCQVIGFFVYGQLAIDMQTKASGNLCHCFLF